MKVKWLPIIGATILLVQLIFFLQVLFIQQSQHDIPNDLLKTFKNYRAANTVSSKRRENINQTSPLYDRTLFYNHSVHRLWLDPTVTQKPLAMILLTTLAWNHPNQTYGLEIYRGQRTRQLIQGIINHPLFHPTAWQDINEGRMQLDDNLRYYVFLDRETAGEKNWPFYGRGVIVNADREGGRGTCCGFQILLEDQVMTSKVMSAPHASWILFDGFGWGPRDRFHEARAKYNANKIIFLSLSARRDQIMVDHDMGMAPPSVRPCRLTPEMEQEMTKCVGRDRPVLLSMLAALRGNARNDLVKLHNGNDMLIGHDEIAIVQGLNGSRYDITDPYHLLAISSQFGAAPRGDNLFSYRFPEVASCGAIPVVYADDWQLPFVYDVVDWQEAVVIIPEQDALHSREILEAIPAERRCLMRKKALEFYHNHLETGHKTVATIIEGLERLAQRRMDTFTGDVEEQVGDPGASPCRHPSEMTGESPLNDQTLCYKSSVNREWLSNENSSRPSAMLMLSNFAWNSRDPQSLRHYRGLWSKELLEGIINHRWFHPTAFEAFVNLNMTMFENVTYILFLDVETCAQPSYPYFGKGTRGNADVYGGRTDDLREQAVAILKRLWRIILRLEASIKWKVVLFSCRKSGPFQFRKDKPDEHLVIASTSALRYQVLEGIDQGLPFPPYRRYCLSAKQREAVSNCNDEDRPYLLTFSGHLYARSRKLLKQLHNGKDIMVGTPWELQEALGVHDPYFRLASQSKFAAVPRGSYIGTSRLMEVISAGAIPVILADHWVLPLSKVINWTEIAVILPEEEASKAAAVVSSLSKDARCIMRKRLMEVYDNYLVTGEGIIDGLVRGVLGNSG